ncbi:hypothetical protein [Streptomyces sp. NRRL S-118]|uniref:hypothetical protein n=1 Tax=Streptomyces sp. NRRL S-118 TaxID=1463881 RepID=UPI0004C8A0BA|nr:hypothetical protein [Streptomyces sp. NRRL S-118]
MGGLFETAAGVIDRRLLASTFLPVLAFLAGLTAVAVSGVGWTAATGWWSATSADIRVLLLVLVLTTSLLLTQLLAVGRVDLIRLYEGYWAGLPFGIRLAERSARRHRRLHASLAETDPRWLQYPVAEDQVMPTRLGNILRGAEEHSAERYGIDAVTAWPRLYPTLPEAFRQTYAAAAADLELAVTVSALGAAFVVLAGVLGVSLLAWPGTLLCVSTGALVAWLGYRCAVSGGESYGRLVRAAFDVHRWCLLDAMGLARPTSVRAELDQWGALDKLWVRGSVDTEQADALGYPEGAQLWWAPWESPAPSGRGPLPGSVESADSSAQSADSSDAGVRPPLGAAGQGPPPRPGATAPGAGLGPDPGPESEPSSSAPAPRPEPTPGPAPPAHPSAPELTHPDRPRHVRPTTVALVILFLGACAAVAVRSDEPPRHPTAVRDLPAYHLIAEGDVRGDGERDVRDRHTLRAIPAGTVVRSADLGPRARPGHLRDTSVIALGPPTTRLHAPVGIAGATVTLVAVPARAQGGSVSVPGVFVIALTGPRERLGVILAVPRVQAARVASQLGAGTVHLLVPGR